MIPDFKQSRYSGRMRGNMAVLKYSRQREAIQRFLMTRKDHPTADIVYNFVRHEFPNISLGTVYRNLTLLSDIGEITRLRVGDGIDRFDADTRPHYHFVCTECGCVTDFDPQLPVAIDQLCGVQQDGRLIVGHVAYFYGICSGCRRKANR